MSLVGGPLWAAMHVRPRLAMGALRRDDLPDPARGVYAVYRDGRPVYVGMAAGQSLQGRVWNSHRGRGPSMGNSALRRNVAEHLEIATSADIKARRHTVTRAEADRVNAWLDACEIAWITTADGPAAQQLETGLKNEHRPRLTKQ